MLLVVGILVLVKLIIFVCNKLIPVEVIVLVEVLFEVLVDVLVEVLAEARTQPVAHRLPLG